MTRRLLASVYKLDAVALILEFPLDVECSPAIILTLILVRRRTDRWRRAWRSGIRGQEGGIVNHAVRINDLVSRPAWIACNGRTTSAAPPVVLCVQRARMTSSCGFETSYSVSNNAVCVGANIRIGPKAQRIVYLDAPHTVAQNIAVDR